MSDTSITKCKTLNGKVFAVAFFLVFSPELSFAHNGHCPVAGATVVDPATKYRLDFTPPPVPPPKVGSRCPGMDTTVKVNSDCTFDAKEKTFCETAPVTIFPVTGNYAVTSVSPATINGQEFLLVVCELTSTTPAKQVVVNPCHTVP